MVNPHKGSTFDSFLEEEKILDFVEAIAIKRVLSRALHQTMKQQHAAFIKLRTKKLIK